MDQDIMLHTDRRGDEYWLGSSLSDEEAAELEEAAEDAAWLDNQEYAYGH